MDVISRGDALMSKFTHYYTGQPCLRGHVARRYVTNGACVDCLHEKAGRAPATKRSLARVGDLAELRLRVFDVDWPMIRDTAHAYFLAVYPDHNPPPDRAPRSRAAGTAMYTVRVPVEYAQAMRDVADAMLGTHKPDMTAIRAEILRHVCAIADVHGARPE